jgi:flavodoxin I
MKKIGIFYASDTGNTEIVAEKLKQVLGEDNAVLYNVSDADAEDIAGFNYLIFSSPTWGRGDLQDDFVEFIEELDKVNFSDKKVALFGLGDGVTYDDTFVDAMGQIYDKLIEKSCHVVGSVSTEGYNYANSMAVREGKFIGLALDEDNQAELTDERIEKWVNQLKNEFL